MRVGGDKERDYENGGEKVGSGRGSGRGRERGGMGVCMIDVESRGWERRRVGG